LTDIDYEKPSAVGSLRGGWLSYDATQPFIALKSEASFEPLKTVLEDTDSVCPPQAIGTIAGPRAEKVVAGQSVRFDSRVLIEEQRAIEAGVRAATAFLSEDLVPIRVPACVDVIIDEIAAGWGLTSRHHVRIYTSDRGRTGGESSWRTSKTAAHELVHVWQSDLGGLDSQEAPAWLVEGTAEYLSHQALAQAGIIPGAEALGYAIRNYWDSGRLLQEFEAKSDAALDEYSTFHLAVHYLTQSRGPATLTTFWTALGDGRASEQAFIEAFDLSLPEFYSRWESYRKSGFQ
jgi:hypothetical protein